MQIFLIQLELLLSSSVVSLIIIIISDSASIALSISLSFLPFSPDFLFWHCAHCWSDLCRPSTDVGELPRPVWTVADLKPHQKSAEWHFSAQNPRANRVHVSCMPPCHRAGRDPSSTSTPDAPPLTKATVDRRRPAKLFRVTRDSHLLASPFILSPLRHRWPSKWPAIASTNPGQPWASLDRLWKARQLSPLSCPFGHPKPIFTSSIPTAVRSYQRVATNSSDTYELTEFNSEACSSQYELSKLLDLIYKLSF